MTLEEAKQYRYWFKYEYKDDDGKTLIEDRQNFIIEEGEYGENTINLYLNDEFVEAYGKLEEANLIRKDEADLLVWLFNKFIKPCNDGKFIQGKYTNLDRRYICW